MYLGTLVHKLQGLGPTLDDLVGGKGQRLPSLVAGVKLIWKQYKRVR